MQVNVQRMTARPCGHRHNLHRLRGRFPSFRWLVSRPGRGVWRASVLFGGRLMNGTRLALWATAGLLSAILVVLIVLSVLHWREVDLFVR